MRDTGRLGYGVTSGPDLMSESLLGGLTTQPGSPLRLSKGGRSDAGLTEIKTTSVA